MIEQDYSKMSQKEFEKIIYQTFPVIFKLIKGSNKYVFNIGSGWFPLLYELCEQLNTISNKTRIDIVATEIEEHFGVFKFHVICGKETPTSSVSGRNCRPFVVFVVKNKLKNNCK